MGGYRAVNPESNNAKRIESNFAKVLKVIRDAMPIDKERMVERPEFMSRVQKVNDGLSRRGIDVGFVFSDQHYCGDVPYLGGNSNITVEQVAGIVGKTGFHLLAGLEGGYVAEQLSERAGAKVHKIELLQLADEVYPVESEHLEDILREANGGIDPTRVGLLTPRQVIPASIVDHLNGVFGAENVFDCFEMFARIKYEKSMREMELVRDAAAIADATMTAMLAVLEPGMLETQVAAWGHYVAKELGAEELGFDIMVGANEANRSLIGKALNREIRHGDWVHLGVGTKRDGLNACIRRSVIAVASPDEVSEEQRYWFDLVEGAYRVGYEKYCEVAAKNLRAKVQERSLVDYYASKSKEVSKHVGREIALEKLKPYTGTHNSGYTECQEFFGAITLDSEEPLGETIVTMMDVALRGIGNHWNDIRIPGFDYLVIENTLGKFGRRVETFTKLPLNVQKLVGGL
jgi:Xaa-Pro aminopeptidase